MFPRLTMVAASLYLSGVLVACGDGGGDDSDATVAASEPTGPVITAARVGDWPAAELTGSLDLSEDCLLLEGAVAVFPARTTWREDVAEVVFASGAVVRVGRDARFGGGLLPADGQYDQLLTDESAAAVAACVEATGATEFALLSLED